MAGAGLGHFLFLRPAPLAPAYSCLGSLCIYCVVHRAGQTSLLLKPSMAPQSPGLSPDFTQPPGHTCHLASGVSFLHCTFLCLPYTVQSLHKALSLPWPHPSSFHIRSVVPSLCTPSGSHHPAQLSNPWAVPNPRYVTFQPCWQAQGGKQWYGRDPPPRLPRIKQLETQGSGG